MLLTAPGLQLPNVADWLLIAIGVMMVLVSVRVYQGVTKSVVRQGGRVNVTPLSEFETITAAVLLSLLAIGTVSALINPTPPSSAPLDGAHAITQSLYFAIIPVVIVVAMAARGVPIAKLYGLRNVRLQRVLGLSLGLIMAVAPLLVLCSIGSQLLLGEDAAPQPLVLAYQDAVKTQDFDTLTLIIISAVVIAPFTEELLFRGFFYPALKRRLGGPASAVITALIFAAIHQNALSFAGLTVLALALTLAYEWTGSLLVNMAMHAVFNAVNLGAMWWWITSHPN